MHWKINTPVADDPVPWPGFRSAQQCACSRRSSLCLFRVNLRRKLLPGAAPSRATPDLPEETDQHPRAHSHSPKAPSPHTSSDICSALKSVHGLQRCNVSYLSIAAGEARVAMSNTLAPWGHFA
jgi:hypothetical protein